jgi:hypothetical protein
MDLLRVATAPAAQAATVRISLIVILAAEAVTGVEATAVAKATRTASPPALHVAASTPTKKSKNYDAKSPPRQVKTSAPDLMAVRGLKSMLRVPSSTAHFEILPVASWFRKMSPSG